MLSRVTRLAVALLAVSTASLLAANPLPVATPASALAPLTSARPVITAQPAGGAVDLFGTFSLSVEATGAGPLTYQWKLDGTPIEDATAATYFVNGAGSYSVAVTNAAGTTESATAVVQPDDPSIALKPFAIPVDTPTGVFPDLRSWNTTPAGAAGVVTVGSDGHFQVGGRRIRFFGADITSHNNFPTHDEADQHAQRLARFGFNSVRLHWGDSYWPYDIGRPGSLIIKDERSSTGFDLYALDRLHYFMARCADAGIYSDVNLLVARTFQADDGLGEEVATMRWAHQHLLSFFNDKMVELQKEYASKLLGTPNPYRKDLPLAEDPAVAIVEIMNEIGLLDGWVAGDLALIPSRYTDELQRRWANWLQARYADQAALYAGWYAADEPLGANSLADVNAALGPQGWYLYVAAGAKGTTSITQDYNGASCRMIDATAVNNYTAVQLVHKDLTLTAHKAYTLSFWAKVEAPATVHKVKLYADRPGYTDLCEPIEIEGTAWKRYSRTFVMRATEERSRLGFCLGAAVGKTWIADVQLRPGGTVGMLPAGVTLAARNIPALLTDAPTDHLGMREDWARFLRDLEKVYWTTMRDYVRSLGFKSVIVGTIVRSSGQNTQSLFDAMDTHEYWNYPDIGDKYGQGDNTDWSMPHRAMVNSPHANEVVYSAWRQVKGYPNIVTEFEHPAPNLYAGEQEFLFPSYAALQDLDGYWVYSYWTMKRNWIWNHFDSLNSMNKLANTIIAAALFRRDVSPAQNEYVLAMTPARELAETVKRGVTVKPGKHFNMPQASLIGMPSTLSLVSRIRMSIGEEATGLATPPARPPGPVYVSDTGELRWDSTDPAAGFFTVNTPLTKAFSGFGSGLRQELGGVAITPGTNRLDWCTIGVTLLEGDGFSSTKAGRALIVATGQYANTGWLWRDETHTNLTSWGDKPFLAEIVSGEVELPVPASRVKVWALSGAGTRGEELPVTNKSGRTAITLGTVGDTLWYEVQISADPATTYTTWRSAHFSGADLTNNAISGPTADPDRAGLTNYARYAFALSARGQVGPPVTPGSITTGGATYLTLTFNRRATATDATYTVESSPDLVTWTPVPGAVYAPGAASPVTYRDTVALASAARRFLRLRVSGTR
ncbi:MAG: carbohydrate binding domain-containing protein [Opitutaceae bacterium]|nr:carbohydrate binding domain-containing protein [Opitutaceae bacterium]